MPHWICPLCQASCNVPASALGRTLKCPACREMSPVSNGDLVDDAQQDRLTAQPKRAAIPFLIATAVQSRLTSVTVSVVLLALLVPLMFFAAGAMILYMNWITGLILLGSLAMTTLIASPIFTGGTTGLLR